MVQAPRYWKDIVGIAWTFGAFAAHWIVGGNAGICLKLIMEFFESLGFPFLPAISQKQRDMGVDWQGDFKL